MSKKIDNVRLVTFTEDYFVKAKNKEGKRIMFRKGTTKPMHQRTADDLQLRGAKVSVKAFDEKKELAKARAEFEESQSAQWK